MQQKVEKNNQLAYSLNLNNLRCLKNNQAFRICLNPQCQKPSIMCRQKKCQCQNDHYDCISMMRIQKFINFIITQLSNTVPQALYQEYQTIIKEINNAIDKLSQLRQNVQYKKTHYGISQKHLEFIKICQNKDFEKLKGKLVSQIINQKIQKNKDKNKFRKNSFTKEIQKELNIKFNNLIEDINNKINYIEKQNIFFHNSKIVNSQQSHLLLEMITQTLKKSNLKSQLLFRASQNQFSSFQFHKKCDNIKNTVTIVETQFGKKIGGFNPATWNSASNNYFKDPSKTVFIFSLSLKEKFTQYINSLKNIYCEKNWGPTFGGGNGFDIGIYHQANNNTTSYGAFPSAYKDSNNKYQEQNQQTSTLWTGATNGRNFKVKEYQVYEIKIQQ